MKKILLVCVTSQNVITFRRSFIEKLKEKNYEVSVVAFDREYEEEIKKLGIGFFCIEDNNRSTNPLKILSLKSRYKKVIQSVKPDIVFSFMLKPNTFGVLAAKSAGVKQIFSMVEGIGDVFVKDSLKWKIVRTVVSFLYKRSLRHSSKVFFLNPDDIEEFVSRGLVQREKCQRINGIGVDLEHFSEKPIKNLKSFIMVARMLRTKGVFEYCECARRVKKQYPDAVFSYLGGEGNVKVTDIQEYIDDGSINYLGTAKDVRPYLEDSICFVLPSYYREGLPMSIMEAEATGRCIITTDNVGCRETVKDGYNGFLLDCHDVDGLAEKCIYIIENPEQTLAMCKNSRQFAIEHFDQKEINQQIMEILES